ncbi:hypothetical protein LWI28_013358 [Acer negundo]|uniref:Uncharacterized protein n=1 Tax=Acer negundo TaxID=4023 RepID=A0AAD5NSB3_ACENE|nr:hypothetical protein LWI28_013358 [Acer negundo]
MGETLVLSETSDSEALFKAVQNYKLNYCGVPSAFMVSVVKSELTKYDLSSLKFLVSGGAPLGTEAYGLTEAGPVAAMTSLDKINKLGSVGRLVEVVEAKIVDLLTGELLSPGQRGELWMRGPSTMKGNTFVITMKIFLQVPPAELEHLLITAIADAAVVPYPDEDAGQIPMAFVVRKPGTTITDTQIMDYIAKQA